MSEGQPDIAGPEYHVASFVLHVDASGEAAIRSLADEVPALEIHAVQQGKMVVTAEAGHTRDLAKLADRLAAQSGVLQLSPVYHEFDAAPDAARAQKPLEDSPWT